MDTLRNRIVRTVYMGGDVGEVDVTFDIYIDRDNAAVLACAEGLSGTLTLRDHPIGPALIEVRNANLGYRDAVNDGSFDALVTFEARIDAGLPADRPNSLPPTIGLPAFEDEGEDGDEDGWDEDRAQDAELERQAELAYYRSR